MKRPLSPQVIKVIALLLAWMAAGAALNVAVAWGLAIWSPKVGDPIPYRNGGEADPKSLPLVPKGWTPDQGWSVASRQLVGSFEELFEDPPFELLEDSNGPQVCLEYISTGLPLQGMAGARWTFQDDAGVETTVLSALETGINPKISTWTFYAYGTPTSGPSTVTQRRLVPLRPLWPGFAINTVFYAGVLWVLCCGPFALRRMIRRRRGRCPACAYPIGQSPVCTECGQRVKAL